MQDQRLADRLWMQDQRREAVPPSASDRGYDFRPDPPKDPRDTPLWVLVFCIIAVPSVLIVGAAMLGG